jgi:hypothetical protein
VGASARAADPKLDRFWTFTARWLEAEAPRRVLTPLEALQLRLQLCDA